MTRPCEPIITCRAKPQVSIQVECLQRNVKPIRSPRTPEGEQTLSQPAGALAGLPGQLSSRMSGRRELAVTAPEQLQRHLVQLCLSIALHHADCPMPHRAAPAAQNHLLRTKQNWGSGSMRMHCLPEKRHFCGPVSLRQMLKHHVW